MISNNLPLPMKGLGTYLLREETMTETIKEAIKIGYRHFDTASMYKNEESIGKALNIIFKENIIKRSEIFITTKIWNNEKDDVEKSLKNSLSRLQLDYVDSYLIHWPFGYYDQENKLKMRPLHKIWKEMEDCVHKGLCKSIGLSNFNVQIILDLLAYAEIKPSYNEIEFHPYLNQENLVKFCQSFGIQIIGYSPFFRMRKNIFDDEIIKSLSEKYKQSPSKIILRWCLHKNVAVIPKSDSPERLKENFFFDDFEIEIEDIKKIDGLNSNARITDKSMWENFKVPLFD